MAITHPKSLAHTHVGVWTGSVRPTLGQNGSRLSIGRMWISITKLKVTNTVVFPTPFHYLFPFPDGKFYIWVQYQELKVAYWVKHWTAHRKVQGSSPTCSRDSFLFRVHSALPQKLSRRFTFMSFRGTVSCSSRGTP